MTEYRNRHLAALEAVDGDGYLALNYERSDIASLRYLTGFTGEGIVLLSAKDVVLLTDSRYTEQARGETDGIVIVEDRSWRGKAAADAIASRELERVVVASDRVSYRWVEQMKELGSFELVPVLDPIMALRRIKSSDELACLRRAAAIADDALATLLPELRVGMTEAEAALRLEILIRETEAEGISFPFNASTGPNAALNHYDPSLSPKPLAEGDLLLFDFGACVGGYRSDITRTVSVGAASARAKEIYEIVLRANLTAIDAVRSGVSGESIDVIARDLIAEAGYGDAFGHGLGHGIGLEVHEAPGLRPSSTDTLEPGMVATIEPGIYLPGFGGVRIEDDVIVCEDGCDVITAFPKGELIEVG
jgi:Xaa-Pro aminopeptidase